MINNRTFEHRPISELLAIVKNDLRKLDDEGLIDEGTLIKTIMYCNDKLGIPIREIREVVTPVQNFKAPLPLDFEKLIYICGLRDDKHIRTDIRNPFDNNIDQDCIYKAKLDRGTLGCAEHYKVTIITKTETLVNEYQHLIPLSLSQKSFTKCNYNCINKNVKGRYTIEIEDDNIIVPFKEGELYMSYLGMMKDSDGNLTFPFHPMITPYYEWAVKEKILEDAIFNSDATNISELYQLASRKRGLAWLDAFNFTTEREYGAYVDAQRKKEMKWYNQYFKYFQ